jgi:anaerobic magnesium-protoporphyrin IX monomethyl ester cyclase
MKNNPRKSPEKLCLKNIRILFCNVPIRKEPSSFPPVACTTLCNVLIRAGYFVYFYDIDSKRPSLSEIIQFIKSERFDVVAISAVVSTSYKYVKEMTNKIKEVFPEIKIILGGNLAASYEIILRKCGVDICAIGEGDKSILNIADHLNRNRNSIDYKQILKVKGFAYLDPEGKCNFTGYEKLIDNNEIQQPDYEFLEKYSNINQYIQYPLSRYDFACDSRSHEQKRRNKKLTTIFASRGCVNRCTFCHRWIPRYRIISAKKVIDYMKYLMEKYNVGFFCIADESFGENRRWLDEFIDLVRPLDVLFQIDGARVSIVRRDPSIIKKLKEVGLTAVYFGMESGSDKILNIMEKNAKAEDNLLAAKECIDAEIYTIIQLIIGMPGENDKTINQTINFLKEIAKVSPYIPETSTNYLQALPGSPCYEYLRYKGLLGSSIDDEEEYLLKVSNVNAADFRQYINVSESSLDRVRLWNAKVNIIPKIHWLKKHKWNIRSNLIYKSMLHGNKKKSYSVFVKIKKVLKNQVIVYRLIDFTGDLFWNILLFKYHISIYGFKKTILGKYAKDKKDRKKFIISGDGKSLRKILYA